MYKPRPGLICQLFMRASRVQKKRAILTIASIAWGSLSLLLLLAFGEGLKISVARGMNGIGSDLAILWPGTTSLVWQGLPAGRPITGLKPLKAKQSHRSKPKIGSSFSFGMPFSCPPPFFRGYLKNVD